MGIRNDLGTGDRLDISSQVLISADSHVMEPVDLWKTRLPVDLQDKVPAFVAARRGTRPGGWDSHSRVQEMTQDGVSTEVLCPTFGMQLFKLENAELQEACFHVYNDWLMEYCSVAPNRLVGIALLATYNIDHAIEELVRCRKAGLPGAMVWNVPHPSLPFHSDHYDRLWAAAQDLDVPINLHIATGFDYSSNPNRMGGLQRYRELVNLKLGHVANSIFDLIFSGVLERFPKLRLVLVETEIGWLPFLLQQWDYYFERNRKTIPLAIDKKPSEYFARQMYATFFNDAVGCRNLSWWGVDNCMWSTDYPHPNTSWPHSRELVHKHLGHLPEESVRKLVHDNVVQLYGLKTMVPPPAL